MTAVMTPSEAASDYPHWVQGTGLGATTKELYSARISRFLAWLDAAGDEYAGAFTDPYVRDFAVRDYQETLVEARYAISTIEQHVSAICNFYGSYLKLGKPNVPRSRPIKGAPKGLTDKDKQRVLRVSERRGIRDHALTAFILYSAVRVGECARVDRTDLLLTDKTGKVHVRHGKGGVQRYVPVPAPARAALNPWLAHRDSQWGQMGPLFMSRESNGLSKSRMQSLIADIGKTSGVPLHPHMLRHTFARNFLEGGGDLGSLQSILGHKHLSSTQAYIQPNYDDLAAMVESIYQ